MAYTRRLWKRLTPDGKVLVTADYHSNSQEKWAVLTVQPLAPGQPEIKPTVNRIPVNMVSECWRSIAENHP